MPAKPSAALQLPTGFVTFLFTDIEGSTRLWETEPERMAAALARHDELCHAVVATHGGRLVKMTGDGLLAVFDDAAAAVATALELQRGMNAIAADCGLAFRMRSGLHAGVSQARAGDYFGTEVNRAARIISAAHGGQILLSQAVVEQGKGCFRQDVDLLRLGRFRLRDLSRPEEVWQLLHSDLQPAFPALRSLDAIPKNLPQPLTSFIGREKEIAEVEGLLPTTRLLTLSGSGGCGKTRLSLQVAADGLESSAGRHPAGDRARRGAHAFAVGGRDRPAPRPALHAADRGLARGAAAAANAARADRLELRLAGRDRASVVRPAGGVRWRLRRERRGEGLRGRPAGGMGGAGCTHRPCRQEPRRCRGARRRDPLPAAGDDAPACAGAAAGVFDAIRERHRDHFLAFAEEAEPNLKGAEQARWLQRLDDENENLRAAFESCLAAAASNGGLRLCGALRQFWWMRGYVAEGREWCARALAQVGCEAPTRERANGLSAAGALAYLQADYAAAKAQHEESLAICRQLADRRGIATSLSNLGVLSCDRGDCAPARALFEESLTILRQLEDPWGIAIALGNLGRVANEQGDYPEARSRQEESLVIKRKLGNRAGIANTLEALANVAHAQGDLPAARTLHVESLSIKRELGNRLAIASSLSNLGTVACEQGEFATAREQFRESLAILGELGDRRNIAFSLEELAAIAAKTEGPLPAARIWGAAERPRVEIGSPLPRVGKARYDRFVAAARAALGDDAALDRAWQEGRVLTLEQAMEIAVARMR